VKYPLSIQNLINELTKLPSVGPKTAERYVFYLLNRHDEEIQKLAQAIAELKEKTQICKTCFLISESDPCPICADKQRDNTTIAIISNSRDLLAIEATGEYSGKYHILGGVLNPLDGIDPERLNIKSLLSRLKTSPVKEIILALNPNMEGEATAMYLAKLIRPMKIKISRIAKGLPMGADIEYADGATLNNAMKYRNIL
jgi:recombination protein RecR